MLQLIEKVETLLECLLERFLDCFGSFLVTPLVVIVLGLSLGSFVF